MQRWGLWNAVEHGGACAMSGTGALTMTGLDVSAEGELRAALARMERGRNVVVRAADLFGGMLSRASSFGLRQMGFGGGRLPARFAGIAEAALARAYDVAILGLAGSSARASTLSQAAVIGSGALSGFAGLAGFVPDAAFTTLTIMREIARIAAQQGEDLSTDDARRACLEVFAFQGGKDESELDYFSARFALGSGTFTRLLSDVAARYGSVLGEKFGLQAVPVAGAIAGASLNAAFLGHYRNLAKAHFAIRRLEREHGREAVRAAADAMNHGQHAPFNAA